MNLLGKTLVLAMLTASVVVLSSRDASAQTLSGTYRIRQGDETVRLTYIGRDAANQSVEIYSLTCNGVFTCSSGTLRYNKAINSISVKVTVVRDFLGCALKGNGTGFKKGIRTLQISGLKLDNAYKTLLLD